MGDNNLRSADFDPTMGSYTDLRPFRFWCQKVLPLVYDDSLSYYEVLCKVVDYLNKAMEDVGVLHEDVEALHTAFGQLQSYVNDYFDNLDIQDEINNKLDTMASDGTLDALLLPYFNAYKDEINGIISTQNQTLGSQNNRISILEQRMDTFASLTPGSTTGDAELTDIRVGADGITYSTAGDSVRGQLLKVSGDIASVYNSGVSYVVGDVCTHELKLYKCVSNTTGTWNPSAWEELTIFPLLSDTTNEVKGIRLGADDIEYTNAGKAVREQIKPIMDNATNGYKRITIADYETQGFTVGKYFYGEVGQTIMQENNSALYCKYYGEVDKGDVFYSTNRSVGDGYSIYITDENDKVLSYFLPYNELGYYDSNTPYVAPYAGKMYINANTPYIENHMFKLEKRVKDYSTLHSVIENWSSTSTTVAKTANDLEVLKDDLPKRYYRVVKVDATTEGFETGKFYTGAIGSVIGKNSYTTLDCMYYGEVLAGDVYFISGNRKLGTAYAIYVTDENDVIVGYYEPTLDLGYYDPNVPYTIPEGGKKMYLNVDSQYITDYGTYKLEKQEVTYDADTSPLKGIKWCSIGDSICAFNSYANNNWIRDLINSTGIDNTNLAISGSGFYRGAPREGTPTTNYISRISSIPSDTDFITVCGSFNDTMTSPWDSLPIGTPTDTGSTTIAGYMNAFFDALLSAFPTVPIAVMMTSPWDSRKPGVQVSDDYTNVLKSICLARGIPFNDDCYKGCNLRPWIQDNLVYYYTHPNSTLDGVHPNDKGHVLIYRMLKPFIEKCVYSLR